MQWDRYLVSFIYGFSRKNSLFFYVFFFWNSCFTYFSLLFFFILSRNQKLIFYHKRIFSKCQKLENKKKLNINNLNKILKHKIKAKSWSEPSNLFIFIILLFILSFLKFYFKFRREELNLFQKLNTNYKDILWSCDWGNDIFALTFWIQNAFKYWIFKLTKALFEQLE